MGINPTHAAILPNNSRVFVVSAGSLFPRPVGRRSPPFRLPHPAARPARLGKSSQFYLSQPGTHRLHRSPQLVLLLPPRFFDDSLDHADVRRQLRRRQRSGCTNLGSTDSVAFVSNTSNSITNIAYLPAGSHPVALAETPDAQHLYVVNQGNDTVRIFHLLTCRLRPPLPSTQLPSGRIARRTTGASTF